MLKGAFFGHRSKIFHDILYSEDYDWFWKRLVNTLREESQYKIIKQLAVKKGWQQQTEIVYNFTVENIIISNKF